MIWKETADSVAKTQENAFWLISHASYLLKIDGLLWGVDLRLSRETHQQADNTLAKDLKDLQVALVTHLHADHYDPALIERLAPLDIHWIFPAFMPDDQQKAWRQKLPHCTFMKAGEKIALRGLKVHAFESIHYDYFKGERCGVEEIGYMVEAGGQVYMFPGDVRNYDALPEIQKGADEFFAHVWLGREAALAPDPQIVAAYCDYLASTKAKRIWLGHLNDMSRSDADRWTEIHAQMVKAGVQKRAPSILVEAPEHGKKNLL